MMIGLNETEASPLWSNSTNQETVQCFPVLWLMISISC